jgi:two-component system chemotaxis response regulator CheY
MEFLQYFNQKQFLGFVPKIRENPKEWQLFQVTLTGKTRHNAAYIAKQLKNYFGQKDGIVFICNSTEILALVHMGPVTNPQNLCNDINEKMPKYSCSADAAGELTDEGLMKFQLRLIEAEEKKETNTTLLQLRQQRPENVIMIVDDDMFMRSLISKTFKNRARLIEFDNVEGLTEKYLEEMPDILFLDIHLPGGSGIDALSEILSFDDSAFVIIISSDSVRDNVMEAKKYGAKGFVAKPFTPEKLEACYAKCHSLKPVAKT